MIPELPPGIFSMFMNLWSVLRSTYVTVYEWVVAFSINIAGENINLLYIFIGSGVFVYMGYRLIRWVISP